MHLPKDTLSRKTKQELKDEHRKYPERLDELLNELRTATHGEASSKAVFRFAAL